MADPKSAWDRYVINAKFHDPVSPSLYHYIEQTKFRSFESGILVVEAENKDAADLLTGRIAPAAKRYLQGCFDKSVAETITVKFVAPSRNMNDHDSGLPTAVQPKNTQQIPGQAQTGKPFVLDVRDMIKGIKKDPMSYLRIVEPDKVVVLNAYFKRYIAYLGAAGAWILVAILQAIYKIEHRRSQRNKNNFSTTSTTKGFLSLRNAHFRGQSTQNHGYHPLSMRTISKGAGIDKSTYKRTCTPEYWARIHGLIDRQSPSKPGQPDKGGRSVRQSYLFKKTSNVLPLTPFDAQSLADWIKNLSEK